MKKALAGGLAVIAVLLIGNVCRSRTCDRRRELRLQRGVVALRRAGELDRLQRRLHRPRRAVAALLLVEAGSGNSNMYQMTLPQESRVDAEPGRTGGTWNFQLHPAFWFGMALCDNQSAPEYTHAPCVPDSDTNIFDGGDPTRPTTSATTLGRRSWSCSSTRPAGRPGRRGDQLRRHASGAPRWRSSA